MESNVVYASLAIVLLLGGGSMWAVFSRMKGGFGPFNLRVVGIVLVSTFATLLAISVEGTINSAIGILGALAGYLFGYPTEKAASGNAADASGSSWGDGNKVGR